MEKKKIVLVSLGHLSCDINGGALPAALPYIRTAHNLDYQDAGGLIFAYSCLSSLMQPLLGLLADKHQKPWFIPLGILLAGFGIACIGFLSNYWAIFLGITISGIGSAFFHPEGARFANKVSGKTKGIGLSIFSIGGNSGFIVGPLLVTLFIGMFGLKGMGGFGLIAFFMAIVLFIGISRMPKQEKKPVIPQEDVSLEKLEKEVPQNNWKGFIRLMMVIVCRSVVFTGCNTFIPLYWVSVLNQSQATGAMALVVFGICGVACNILGGMLTDKYGSILIIRCAFFMMWPILAFFALTENLYLSWLCLPFIGLVLYLPFSAQVVLGQTLLGKNIGFASGITLGLATTLGGIAQPCLGWIADGWGLGMIFFTLAAIAFTGSLLSLRLIK